MTLPDEQVLPVCYFWAKRLCTNKISFDELVNEAYIVAKRLSNPLLLQKWVKWTMIHFVQKGPNVPLEDWEVEDKSFDFRLFMEMQEDLMHAVEEVCDEEEQHLLCLIYWKGMSYRKVAKAHCISFQAVFFRVEKILRKLREHYERRAKT